MKLKKVYVCRRHNRWLDGVTGEWQGSNLPDCTDEHNPTAEVAITFLNQECDHCSAEAPFTQDQLPLTAGAVC